MMKRQILNKDGFLNEYSYLDFSSGSCIAMQICFNRLLSGKRPLLDAAVCVAGGISRRIDAVSVLFQKSSATTDTTINLSLFLRNFTMDNAHE